MADEPQNTEGTTPPQPPARAGDGNPHRSYHRRQVIALAGLGTLAVVAWQVGKVLEGTPESGPRDKNGKDKAAKREGRDRERRRKGETATTTPDHAADMQSAVSATEIATIGSGGTARWSDKATWAGGTVPGRNHVAVVNRAVILDTDATVAGVRISPGASLEFDPARNGTLTASGNVIVAGRLGARPAKPTVVHQIMFVGVDEARFVGGHTHEPLASDVGLWVVAAGLLDLQGTKKTAWTRLSDAATKGAKSITVDDATGWRVGDEIVITPTEAPTVDEHWLHHDRRKITSVNGKQIGLDRALEFPHPKVTVRAGVQHRAEVLNLARNVLISGTPEGRSHVIMLATTKAQQVGYVGLHNMGPRQGEAEVLGRYAIHFHGDEDGSRGSLIDGVAVYDSTGHAFAAHLSNGVTFRDCIAHDLIDDAFWWDLSLDGGGRDLVPSDDITYERCVAHFVKSGGNSKFNLTGFLMGAGNGNVARGCVAAGVQGGAESSAGFHWPSLSRDDNTWTFEDNVAHNNRNSGIYFWQNGKPRTLVDGFTAYHCGQGIFAGSYANLVSYRNCTIYACRNDGLVISALPARAPDDGTDATITYDGIYVDQAGLSDYAVQMTKHIGRGGRFTEISNSTFKGGKRAQIGFPEGGEHPQLYDFVACTFEGNEFWLADDVPADTELRVSGGRDPYKVLRVDQPGAKRPEWNAVIATA